MNFFWFKITKYLLKTSKKSRPSGVFWSLFTKNNDFSVLTWRCWTNVWFSLRLSFSNSVILWGAIWLREFCFRFCREFAEQFWRDEKGPLYTVAITTHSSIDWIKQMSTLTLLFDPWHYTANERLSFWGSLFTDLITYFYLIFIVATCLAYRFLE